MKTNTTTEHSNANQPTPPVTPKPPLPLRSVEQERWTVVTELKGFQISLNCGQRTLLYGVDLPTRKREFQAVANEINAALDRLTQERDESERRATLTEKKLRNAWEHGIKIARSYGDNICHFEGEQKEAQWRKFLEKSSFGASSNASGVAAKDLEEAFREADSHLRCCKHRNLDRCGC